jgi:hypothetical protein
MLEDVRVRRDEFPEPAAEPVPSIEIASSHEFPPEILEKPA